MTMIERVWNKARQNPRAIALPEGDEKRTVQAAARVRDEGLANPVLLGEPDRIQAVAAEAGVDLTGIKTIDPADSPKASEYAEALYELRKAKGLTREDAARLVADPMYYGMLMVKLGDADGLVSGAVHTTGDMLRPALQIIKTKPGISVVSSSFLMNCPNRSLGEDGLLVYADCVVVPCPTAKELAEIAVTAADTARVLCGIDEPRVALLSFSTKGSAKHELVSKVQQAVLAQGLVGAAHQEAGGHDVDARLRLDDLQRGPQHVAGGVHRAGNQTVGVAQLDHQHAVVHRVGGQPPGVLPGKALGPAQLVQGIGVGFGLRAACWIDDLHARQVRAKLIRDLADARCFAQQDGLRQPLGHDSRRRPHRAGLVALRQDDAHHVRPRLAPDLFDHAHIPHLRWG